MRAAESTQSDDSTYIIPANIILRYLDIDMLDLSKKKVEVNTDALKRVISDALGLMMISEEAYLIAHPDVRGAIMAGALKSGIDHFAKTGYYEQRRHGSLPFDPTFYRSYYEDIAQTFDEAQEQEMKVHFESKGYFEGRVGRQSDLEVFQKWTD